MIRAAHTDQPMSKTNTKPLTMKSGTVSVRRNRVVRVGSWKGWKLERKINVIAKIHGLSAEEVHFCLSWVLSWYCLTGEKLDVCITDVYRAWQAGELPNLPYGQHATEWGSLRVYDPDGATGLGYLLN